MLFTYSSAGLDQNWLNPTLIGILQLGMSAIDGDENPAVWPASIPAERRLILSRRHGVRDRVVTFWEAYRALGAPQRQSLREAINRQVDLPAVLSDDGPCVSIIAFPLAIRTAVDGLFRFAFEQLGTLIFEHRCLRDIQYASIYDQLPAKICPFCGLNYLRAPGAPRHAMDHFMPISRYPFAGADLRNLPPVCTECNSDYKRAVDVLYDGDGHRRRCSDPYAGPSYQVSLAGSRLFEGNEVGGFRLPQWEIAFVGGPPEQAAAWDAVFKIKERYIRDVLDADFLSWIKHFAEWFIREVGRVDDPNLVVAELTRYVGGVVQDGLADRAFLKAETFRVIHASCLDAENGAEVGAWLHSFIEYGV